MQISDSSVSVESPTVTLPDGPPGNVSVKLRIQNDVTGSEGEESVELTLELVSPMDFSHLIDLDPHGSGVTSQLTITIKDDDRKSDMYMLVLNDYCMIVVSEVGEHSSVWKHTKNRRVWGYAPPGKILKIL